MRSNGFVLVRSLVALAFAAAACHFFGRSVTVRAQAVATRKAAPTSSSLTVDEFIVHLQSEAAEEFEYVESFAEERNMTLQELAEEANVRWVDAIAFEWDRCAIEEDVRGNKCPFVICHSGGHGDGRFDKRRMSGNKRRTQVLHAIRNAAIASGSANATDTDSIWNDMDELKKAAESAVATLSNTPREWCGFVRLNESLAEKIDCAGGNAGGGLGGIFDRDERCTVTPLIMSMKMMPRTVGLLMDAIEEMEERQKAEAEGGADDPSDTTQNAASDNNNIVGDLPKADVYLCPGVITQEMIDDYISRGESTENVDFTAVMTEWLLERTGSDGGGGLAADKSKSAVVEATYWTSSRAQQYESRGDTDRAEFWNMVFDLTLKTTRCDDTFRTKLTWSADLYPPPAFSRLTLTYDNTDDTDDDKWCIVAMIAGIATHTNVCAVEIRQEVKTYNSEASWMVQSGGLEDRNPWYDFGLDGTNQVVAVSDTGIDVDNCYFWDSQHPGPTDFRDDAHRKIVEYHDFVDKGDYQYGHGTHVAGTVLGRRAIDGMEETAGLADGIAHGAKVAFADIGDSSGALYLPGDTTLLNVGRQSIPPLASIHSASWGSTSNYYNSQARNFDNYMFANDDFLVNVAAGNDGKGDAPNTVGAPATFKNGIAVGAAHAYGSDLTKGMLGPAYVADFSSRGPTADGRRKPEIIAPGKYILSAGALPTVKGECDGGVPGAGGSSAGLTSMAGTSMATPVVSGTAALIRQYFADGYYPLGRKGSGSSKSISGALVKAILLNGAQTSNVRGVDNGGGKVTPTQAYDNTIGFGRIDLTKSLYLEGYSDVQAKVWDRQVVVDGAPRRYVVTTDQSNGCTFNKLSATLVWMEPGSVVGCTLCVTNDLDLTVRAADGAVYYPNGLKERDILNNAERVIVDSVGPNQTFTLEVEAYNLDGPDQKFALVVTGCFGGVPNVMDMSRNVFDADTTKEDQDNKRLIIIICCSVGGALVICLTCGWCYWNKRKAAADRAVDEGGGHRGDKYRDEH